MRLTESIGSGCAVALISSAVALVGSTTILGMSKLIPDNHAPSEFEEAARRVALTSLVVGGLSVSGLGFAVKSEEAGWLLGSVAIKQAQIDALTIDIKMLKLDLEVAKELLHTKYIDLGEKRQQIASLQKTIDKLYVSDKQRRDKLQQWEEWWEKINDLDSSYNVLGCKGCKHFSGSNYEGNFFVCAMHPYGMRRCEDWE